MKKAFQEFASRIEKTLVNDSNCKEYLPSVIQMKQTGKTLWIRLQAPNKTHL